MLTRRELLSLVGKAGGALLLAPSALASLRNSFPGLALRITPTKVEIAPGKVIQTVAYNHGIDGSPLRMHEGEPVHVQVANDSDVEEYVHWHGFLVPASVDGTMEERSLSVPPGGKVDYLLVPRPRGSRYVHSHAMAGRDLTRGTYSGQFSFVYVEPRASLGDYDQEIFLSTHEWEGYFTNDELDEEATETPDQRLREHIASEMEPDHWEVAYKSASINGKALGHGEPIRVKEGQRVLFHILNASATENIRLSLPGHLFHVVALDGNLVPRQNDVAILELGVGERVDAVVEMYTPGVWIFGSNDDVSREQGMGVVIEYAGRAGKPAWRDPTGQDWDYSLFSNAEAPDKADVTLPMVIDRAMRSLKGFEQWLINDHAYSDSDAPTILHSGVRHRFSFTNNSDDWHPLHFHRSRFELISIDGKPTTGIYKDVFVIKPFGTAIVDLVPTELGLTLFHCHNQLHMDSGFKKVFNTI